MCIQNFYDECTDFGPTQVKFRLLISSIFDAMNFKNFQEMLEFDFQHFQLNAKNSLHQKCQKLKVDI